MRAHFDTVFKSKEKKTCLILHVCDCFSKKKKKTRLSSAVLCPAMAVIDRKGKKSVVRKNFFGKTAAASFVFRNFVLIAKKYLLFIFFVYFNICCLLMDSAEVLEYLINLIRTFIRRFYFDSW